MRTFYADGVLTVEMAHEEFVKLMKEAEAEGVRMQLETQASFPPRMATNGTRTTAKKRVARKVAAKRTAAKRKKPTPRPAIRGKVKTKGKKRDWKAIVAKRMETMKRNGTLPSQKKAAAQEPSPPIEQAEAI